MDDAVRAAERRYRSSGALEDEVAWIRERLRAGELSAARCELAAFVGHPAAAAGLGLSCEGEEVCLRCYQVLDVLRGLAERGGWEARLRGALTGGRLMLQEVEEEHDRGGWEAVAARLWNTSRPRDGTPLPFTWPELRMAMNRLLELATLRARARRLPLFQPGRAVRALRRFEVSGFRLRALHPLLAAVQAPELEVDWTSLQYLRDQGKLFAAIGAELAPWALGYADPLLDA